MLFLVDTKALISPSPGLMIWTVLTFGIVFLVLRAKAAIVAETRQSLDRIKSEIATLTLLATESVLRAKLDDVEAKRLIDEALSGVDFSKLTGA